MRIHLHKPSKALNPVLEKNSIWLASSPETGVLEGWFMTPELCRLMGDESGWVDADPLEDGSWKVHGRADAPSLH